MPAFVNLIFQELPETVRVKVPPGVIREGKVPAGYFLDQVGAKGMVNGAIRVADYHANLIYHSQGALREGTAQQVTETINSLKELVRATYGLSLAEEVQYIG